MGKRSEFPTQKRLKELFELIENEDEIFFIEKTIRGRRQKTKIGGKVEPYNGVLNKNTTPVLRKFLKIDGTSQLISVWFYIYKNGDYDRNIYQVDHIDNNASNNKISNLRLLNRSENVKNQKKRQGVKQSIYKGVTWRPDQNKWQSRIRLNKKDIHLGYFECEHLANETIIKYKDTNNV